LKVDNEDKFTVEGKAFHTILSYIIQKASVYHTVNGDHVLLQTYCIDRMSTCCLEYYLHMIFAVFDLCNNAGSPLTLQYTAFVVLYFLFFSIFPSNVIVSGSGVSVGNQFGIRRPGHVTSSSTLPLDLPLVASPICGPLEPSLYYQSYR